MLRALEILEQQLRDETLWIDGHEEAIKELESLKNRSCSNCKYNSSKTKTNELICCDKARGYVNQINIVYCGKHELVREPK